MLLSIMASSTKGNKMELSTFKSWGKENIIGYKTEVSKNGKILVNYSIYVVSFHCCFVVCVLFNFENRNFVILFFLKNGFVKHGFVINLTEFVIISGTNIP